MRIPLLAIGLLSSIYTLAVTPKEALDFLYSSMPLPDRVDYTEEFYRANVEASLKARAEMPWGNTVPDREFLHFVLPVRVNNENLDMSRPIFYEELKDRVRGLSMEEAILEVNHWCHEKVTYKPSDARTSSPLSSVSQAIGRCGEESTFTVAALRAVGIPARQIYTPRWAHTDDNHAWVEAWADGRWHFIGACEPEPVLDLAWFNDPASRGLLMTTNVVGQYKGPEEVLLREPLTTRINVTGNYAPVGDIPVKAVYPDGRPAKGAKVNFCIYNYAEYYPAVTKTASDDGSASLTAGLGDMLVWATDGSRFGFAKGRPGSGEVTVVLDKDASSQGSFDFDMIPPASASTAPAVSPEQRADNTLRMQREDSIRNAYMSTFVTPEEGRKIAGRLGLDPERLSGVLVESRGNHDAIVKCLEGFEGFERYTALALLLNVSEKDRRDIPAEVIVDHVANTPRLDNRSDWDSEIYNRYILSPRIEHEFLTPWRSVLRPELQAEGLGKDPEELAGWIDENIILADADNPKALRISPASVLRERKADRLSRDIFFVAAARSLGMPARIDPVTGATQYLLPDGVWKTVSFRDADKTKREAAAAGKASLSLSFTPQGHIIDPKYYSQFSLSRIEGGVPRQLEFDEGAAFSQIFASPVELEPGQYMLTSGQRLANGGVLARTELFTVNEGEKASKTLTVRADDSEVSVIGSLNAENIYHDLDLDADKSILSTTGRGYYIIGIISPNHEPSTHALNDLSAVATQLEATGRKILLLFDNAESASRFRREAFSKLPANVVFGIDNGSASLAELKESLHLPDNVDKPVFAIADTFNRVVWNSNGYTIGIGDTILSILSRIR